MSLWHPWEQIRVLWSKRCPEAAGVWGPCCTAPRDVSSPCITAAVNAALFGKGRGERIEGEKKKKEFFCQETAINSAECDFGQWGAEQAQLGKSYCLTLESRCKLPWLGKQELVGELVVVPGCCWGLGRGSSLRLEKLGTAFLTHTALVQTPCFLAWALFCTVFLLFSLQKCGDLSTQPS